MGSLEKMARKMYFPEKFYSMKKPNYLLYALLVCATVSFSSCKKEGCTDQKATNYSEKAKKDDGSCSYPAVPHNYNKDTNEKLQGSWTVTSHKDSGFELLGNSIQAESYSINSLDAETGIATRFHTDGNGFDHSLNGDYKIKSDGKIFEYFGDDYKITFQSSSTVTLTHTYLNGETIIVMEK